MQRGASVLLLQVVHRHFEDKERQGLLDVFSSLVRSDLFFNDMELGDDGVVIGTWLTLLILVEDLCCK
jgi:hypothetical protein